MALWSSKPNNDLQRRAEWLASQTFVVLSIQVPKRNDKTPVSAEQFFASLHGIYRNDPVVQEHISFEIVAIKEAITFYIFTPLHLREFIEGQLYAQYPDLVIKQVSDYTKSVDLSGMRVASTRIQLTKEDVFPIKTYAGSELDPIAALTAVMAAIEDREQIWFQLIARPVGDSWQDRGVKYVFDVRSGKKTTPLSSTIAATVGEFAMAFIKEVMKPGSSIEGKDAKPVEAPKLSAPQEAALKAIEQKVTKLGFEVYLRLTVISPSEITAQSRTQSMLASFKQYNTTNLNGFTGSPIVIDDYPSWEKFISRDFEEPGSIFNIEELASVYHFPTNAVETSAINWAGSKKGEAPFNLPIKSVVPSSELTLIGRTDYRDRAEEFGLKIDDRRRHTYVIGKSGVGKSTLLENMIIDDIMEGRGVVVVDPHGELADKIVECVPEHRIDDVVILDPADVSFPIAFNPLESIGEQYKGVVSSGFVGIFKKMFGNSWGPRLEYILRNTVLALLDTENPTMLGIPRMLTENAFREQVIEQIKDTVIRDFWVYEWGAMDQKQRTEAMAPILNKVGQFLSSSMVRNLVGQPHSSIDIGRIMNEEKILIVNLSKGKIGEDNMAMLGSMIITKIYLAAMSRASISAGDRKDTFLYVDEFQNFATDSFASILAEARKYKLSLIMAHQYIDQLSDEVKSAVIGNVGTLISFRVGSPDADFLVKEFAPVFEANDLVNLPRAHIYIKLMVDGVVAPAFSAQTLPPKKMEGESFRDEVIARSRTRYAKDRGVVEGIIDETAGFRQKREAQEAKQKASDALTQGAAVLQPQRIQEATQQQNRQASYDQQRSGAPAPRREDQSRSNTNYNQQAPRDQPPRQEAAQPREVQAQRPTQPPRQDASVRPPQDGSAPRQPERSSDQISRSEVDHQQKRPVHSDEPAQRPVEPHEREVVSPAPSEARVQQAIQQTHPTTPLLSEQKPNIGIQPPVIGKAEDREEGSDLSAKPEKQAKRMRGWVYKEVAQRGGTKWYLGEPEAAFDARQEEKRQKLAAAAALREANFQPVESPDLSPALTEQNTNITYLAIPDSEAPYGEE